MNSRFTPPQRIAVIGAGVAGLSCAWLLHRKHQVTLFEANDYMGGHTHTVETETKEGVIAVDTGFIVYNEPNYPNLVGLLSHLNVASRNTEMSFSVSLDRGRYEYAGSNLNTLFAQRSNLLKVSHWKMLKEIDRFNRLAKANLASDGNDQRSLGDFLEQQAFSSDLQQRYLLPMAAAIWSCPPDTMRAFPLRSFLQFFHNHGLLNIVDRPQWKTVEGGSHQYVKRLLQDLGDSYHVSTPVVGVQRRNQVVNVVCRDQDGNTRLHPFDQVILACHGDQALGMIEQPSAAEEQLLGAFHYQTNRTLLHSDITLMPRRRGAWSSWNYLGQQQNHITTEVSVSYWMNHLQGLATDTPLLVSLNPLTDPDPSLVRGEFSYEHPVFDRAAMSAQRRFNTIQGQDRLWFCGSYLGYGFHEDALRSSIEVACQLGCPPPWFEASADQETAAQTVIP